MPSAPASLSSYWLSLAAGLGSHVFAAAAAPCEDKGPWPCTEEGCPAPTVACARLKGECTSLFKSVWSKPPAGVPGDDPVWKHCPVTCGKCDELAAADKPEPIKGKCVSWRQTKDCSPNGKRQPDMDKGCNTKVHKGWSGYCECEGGIRTAESDCKHEEFTCEVKCGEEWAALRQRRQAKVSATGEVQPVEAFDADDSLTQLYKRGKGFYVMGNTELALRHFREALKLDPEHKACKADYKQAKKLSKLLEKIEGVMGKEVEGKGRLGKMDRDEQYEEARTLRASWLTMPPTPRSTTPPHLPAWCLLSRRPLRRTPERSPSRLEACSGLRSSPQVAPKLRRPHGQPPGSPMLSTSCRPTCTRHADLGLQSPE